MRALRLARFAAAVAFVTAAAFGQVTPDYVLADGSSESAVGLSNGGELAWLVGFDALQGQDTISAVHVAWGSKLFPGNSPRNGTPAWVYVWDDTDEDGDPRTGLVLLVETTTVLSSAGSDLLVFTPLASPVTVVGKFFVGASIDHASGFHPAPVDISQPSAGRAWLSGSATPGGFDPLDLNSPGHIGVYDLDTIGLPGVWLLGASNELLQAQTYCTAKLNSCGSLPVIVASGASSAAASSGFVVDAQNARGGNKLGLVIYTNQGRRVPAIPFGVGGLLCLMPPVRRGALQLSAGTAGLCDGHFALDMNAFAAGQTTGNPQAYLSVPGTLVDLQFWGRDTFANGDYLTGGLEYIVLP
jgi:hypothetical protein